MNGDEENKSISFFILVLIVVVNNIGKKRICNQNNNNINKKEKKNIFQSFRFSAVDRLVGSASRYTVRAHPCRLLIHIYREFYREGGAGGAAVERNRKKMKEKKKRSRKWITRFISGASIGVWQLFSLLGPTFLFFFLYYYLIFFLALSGDIYPLKKSVQFLWTQWWLEVYSLWGFVVVLGWNCISSSYTKWWRSLFVSCRLSAAAPVSIGNQFAFVSGLAVVRTVWLA